MKIGKTSPKPTKVPARKQAKVDRTATKPIPVQIPQKVEKKNVPA